MFDNDSDYDNDYDTHHAWSDLSKKKKKMKNPFLKKLHQKKI